MAGVITTGNHPKALWPGVKAVFGASYDEYPAEYPAIFDKVPSDMKYEEYFETTGFSLAPQKPEGDSLSYASEAQGYDHRVTNVTYGLGYIVTMEELMDNLYAKVSERRAKRLAWALRQTKENVAANILNRGFNSSYTYGDGKELLATDHPTEDGTQSNELATSADLSETSLEDLTIQVSKATNTTGLRIQLKPSTLIAPPDEIYNATRILESTLQNDTANNAINALRAVGIIPEVAVNHYLTDSDAFFVKTNIPEGEGLIYQERMSIDFDQDNEFNTKNAKAAGIERYAFSAVDWRSIYGSPGA